MSFLLGEFVQERLYSTFPDKLEVVFSRLLYACDSHTSGVNPSISKTNFWFQIGKEENRRSGNGNGVMEFALSILQVPALETFYTSYTEKSSESFTRSAGSKYPMARSLSARPFVVGS